jgi:hypothetical protein
MPNDVSFRVGCPRRLTGLRRWLWLHPEWWTIVVAIAAWVAMIPHLVANPDGRHLHPVTPGSEAGNWLLMVCAMMLPLLVAPVRVVAHRSYPRRRHASVALFVGGYRHLLRARAAGRLARLAA